MLHSLSICYEIALEPYTRYNEAARTTEHLTDFSTTKKGKEAKSHFKQA